MHDEALLGAWELGDALELLLELRRWAALAGAVAKAQELVDADAEDASELGEERSGDARPGDFVVGVGLLGDAELLGERLLAEVLFLPQLGDPRAERLKSEVATERLVASGGIELKRAGKDLLGRCPFHKDAEASLVVTPAKNLWHCFGCGAGAGPIDWVMRTQGVSFRHAVQLLREGLALKPAQARKVTTVRRLPAPVTLGAEDQVLLNQVVGYYHETLKQAPEALAYLKARGIDHPEAIDKHRLGYANRTLGLRLPNNQRVAGEAIRGQLERIGILRASGHEHFAGSLVIPVLDEQGNVTEVYGRKIRDDLRAATHPARLERRETPGTVDRRPGHANAASTLLAALAAEGDSE